ncbi:MAG: hypothetical protein ACOYMN_25545 [Roseimicrobium sp.]
MQTTLHQAQRYIAAMNTPAQQNGRGCRGTARPIGELERTQTNGILANRNAQNLRLPSGIRTVQDVLADVFTEIATALERRETL